MLFRESEHDCETLAAGRNNDVKSCGLFDSLYPFSVPFFPQERHR